ncbi:MAG: molybdopterin molybdotransferase MoeA [Gloeomargaritaceae cyanobacterium C42_A2020_066]|nr:molybdopterin molybdotransferase MoeA [Gloeomargaritaceae cyanobacterium C42_A2020_066]
MLSPTVALAQILDSVVPLGRRQSVPLTEALGRPLAEPVVTPWDVPAWDNSAMDGYAVRAVDVATAQPDQPVYLRVVSAVAAGQVPQVPVQPGEAARIFTGAMLPPGADTILIQEHTQRLDSRVAILQAAPAGTFIRQQGSFAPAGRVLLTPPATLGAPELAILAASGYAEVSVLARPRVVLLSTGDELVPAGHTPQPGQLVDSNQPALVALVRQAGAEPMPLGIVADTPEALRAVLDTAIQQADLVISTGGVSVGDYDYVRPVLESLGATFLVTAVAVKPGKPLLVARLPRPAGPDLIYVGLPGNPASAWVGFWRFVYPALNKLAGRPMPWTCPQVMAQTTAPLQAGRDREFCFWGRLTWGESCTFTPASGLYNSGNLVSLAGCNSLAMVPAGERVEAGRPVKVLMLPM